MSNQEESRRAAETDNLDEATDAQVSLYANAPDDDLAVFAEATAGLSPPNGLRGDGRCSEGKPLNGSLGPHSVRAVREISRIAKPKSILEIGFHMGYSASLWLHFNPKASVLSVDISGRDVTRYGAAALKVRHAGRFDFIQADSGDPVFGGILSGAVAADLADERGALRRLAPRKFDFAFIDGDHFEPGVVKDIRLALSLGVKHLAFDDWWTRFGPGVKSAIARFPELEKVRQFGNVILFANKGASG